MAGDAAGHVPVAVTLRSEFAESYHFGSAVAVDASGDIVWSAGNPIVNVYGRSSNKPMQAVAMVRHGLVVPSHLLALVCASHAGTPAHLDGVLQLLGLGGFDEADLQNVADLPLDLAAARAVIRNGGEATALQMNCSGKHAGMLLTCRAAGWSTESYLDVGHPLQRRIGDTIDELTGSPHVHVGVDGCGAPAHVVPLSGLARAFSAIATSRGAAERSVYDAMSQHPDMVGGPGRDVTALMRAIPGLIAKDGADGVFAGALPDGRAVAIKIADGGDRARPAVFAAGLRALGVDVDARDVQRAWHVPIRGHGQPVGEVRSLV